MIELLRELEFNSLLRRFRGGEEKAQPAETEQPEGVVLTTLAQYQELMQELEAQKDCALLLLAEPRRAPREWGGRILGIAVALSGNKGYFIPRELEGTNVLNLAQRWLEDPATQKRCHNAKWLQLTFYKQGIEIAGLKWTLCSGLHLKPREESESLDRLLQKFYGWQGPESSQLSLDLGTSGTSSLSSQLASKAALPLPLKRGTGKKKSWQKKSSLDS